MTDLETLSAIALTKVHGLTQRHAQLLFRKAGSAATVLAGGEALLALIPDLQPSVLTVLSAGREAALERAREEADFMEAHGIRALSLGDADYPDRLRQCDDAPLVLYYRGTADLNAAHLVSIVGTRHCTEYGKDLCQRLTQNLAALCPDTLVVSGLAYGVDIHAHRGALEAGLDTVAVLAHGLDRIYPTAHRDTAREMLAHGGLLTEYTTRTVPDKGNFVLRNRIVAGMTDACIVVESARKGGAIITAGLAADYSREVFAFPGRVGDKYSEGCNELVRTCRATLTAGADDIVEALGWVTAASRRKAAGQPVQRELFPDLTDEERVLVDLLANSEGKQINELVVASDMPVQRVSSLLFEMEMRGVVKSMAGGRYRLLG